MPVAATSVRVSSSPVPDTSSHGSKSSENGGWPSARWTFTMAPVAVTSRVPTTLGHRWPEILNGSDAGTRSA